MNADRTQAFTVHECARCSAGISGLSWLKSTDDRPVFEVLALYMVPTPTGKQEPGDD